MFNYTCLCKSYLCRLYMLTSCQIAKLCFILGLLPAICSWCSSLPCCTHTLISYHIHSLIVELSRSGIRCPLVSLWSLPYNCWLHRKAETILSLSYHGKWCWCFTVTHHPSEDGEIGDERLFVRPLVQPYMPRCSNVERGRWKKKIIVNQICFGNDLKNRKKMT